MIELLNWSPHPCSFPTDIQHPVNIISFWKFNLLLHGAALQMLLLNYLFNSSFEQHYWTFSQTAQQLKVWKENVLILPKDEYFRNKSLGMILQQPNFVTQHSNSTIEFKHLIYHQGQYTKHLPQGTLKHRFIDDLGQLISWLLVSL